MLLVNKIYSYLRFKSHNEIFDNLFGWIIVFLAVLGWWAISRSISELVMPGPLAVGTMLIDLFSDPIF